MTSLAPPDVPCTLHLVGTWLASSTVIRTWDEDEAMEELALTELADLSKQIARLDPPSHGDDGDHHTHTSGRRS